ncbi:hypothetical protein [Tenacibaculum maritimum]|uniref:hypothetical protein n=1 Tax=Tenacibaculum maritimum TaxID=107401 RepID=UPI003876A017
MDELINIASEVELKNYNKEILSSLIDTYKNIGGNNEYLYSILFIYKKMFDIINDLSVEKQLDIISTSCSIAYESNTNAYSEMNKMNKDINSLSIEELNANIDRIEQKLKYK